MLTKSTTNGRGAVHVEVARADELPRGVPVDAREPSPNDRGAAGRFAEGNSLAIEGGRARSGHTRLARKVALGESFADPRFEPYARAARAFRRAHVATLARSVGGGVCGPGPSSIVASAALQLAGSRFAFEVLADMALGSRLADSSRQNLLAAHELCAREAAARPQTSARELLEAHVPLTLIADLTATGAVPSQEILDKEGLPDVAWWEREGSGARPGGDTLS